MKSNASPIYRKYRPATVRKLFIVANATLWGWFALKFFLTPDRHLLQVAVGALALIGIVAAFAVFRSDLSFIAHAPEGQIDEFLLSQRNRAYLHTMRYVSGLLALSMICGAFGFPQHADVTAGVLRNFIFVLFVTTLISPAGFLALATEDLPEE